MLKDITMYTHNDKSSSYDQFDEFCENLEAKKNCCYIGYEIEIKGKLNTKNGKFFAYSLNGVELKRPVEI